MNEEIIENRVTYLIYIHTNKTNGKRYVGQTKRTMEKRWHQHVLDAFRIKSIGYNWPFCAAIRKYGVDNWEHEIIEDNIETVGAANAAEIFWISHFCSNDMRFGYNLTSGGNQITTTPEMRKRLRLATKKKDIAGVKANKTKNGEIRYRATIKDRGKTIHVGSYETLEEAAIARDIKAIELFGEFAVLNYDKEMQNKIIPIETKDKPNYRVTRKDVKHSSEEKMKRQLSRNKTKVRTGSTKANFIGVGHAYRGKYQAKEKYRACIGLNGKKIHLGFFNTQEEAAKAYDLKAVELHGKFAVTNFPIENYLSNESSTQQSLLDSKTT